MAIKKELISDSAKLYCADCIDTFGSGVIDCVVEGVVMRYGIGYKGSNSRIAKEIIEILPSGDRFSVAYASFSMFVNMLEYKADWYGRTIVKIDRFYPSTQICSGCGFKNKDIRGMKGLKVREWICPQCGEVHDRDINASRNIDGEGLRILNRRNDGNSLLTECHTDGLISSSDVLAREATQPSGVW